MAADGGRKALRGLGVLLALGLSVAAVLLVVFGNDAKTIRVGVILGAWGLMFGGLSLYPRRNALAPPTNVETPAPMTSKALELRDDAAARREFERVLEAMLHRELDRGLRSELDSLRGEMAGLRGEVSQAMRNQVSLERVETRIVGADLAELKDEVRRHGPAGEPKPMLVNPPKPSNSEITEVIAAVREEAPPPAVPPRPSFAAPARMPIPMPAPAPVKSAAPAPTSAPAWSPSSVELPSLVSNPMPPPPPPLVQPPVTPALPPLGARRVPPVGPPRPSAPTPVPTPVPQFAVPGPPVWAGPSSVDLSAPPRPVDSTVPRPARSPSLGNGTSLPPRSVSSPAPQEMRWPWQEETKRAADPISTPLAPKLPQSVPTVAAPSVAGPSVAGPSVAAPVPRPAPPPPLRPTPTAGNARPAITRSDPFAGLPRLTPAAELDLPELLPDLPPPPPPAPLPAPAPITPPVPAGSAPGPTRVAGRHSDAPPEAPLRADPYVGRRRAGY
jgi:hypothetical protein